MLEGLPQSGAAELLDWHNYLGQHFAMLAEIARGEFDRPTEEDLEQKAGLLVGELSYLRCLIIYSAAETELALRRRHPVEEEPDERDEWEQRRDDEQEAAERQLDSEKVGDV